MTVGDFSDFVAYTKQHFEEGLIRAGFTEHGAGWSGLISHSAGPSEVAITLKSRFPFTPPRVVPSDSSSAPWSWHRELDGALCLIAEDDHEDLWWTEASTFIEHITAWFEASDAGWAGDRPDLDLERYFKPADDKRLHLYGDLNDFRDTFVRFVRAPNNTMKLAGKGTRPTKLAKNHSTDKFGYLADLGEVDSPPRDWADVVSLIQPSVDVEKRIREHTLNVLVLLYNRDEHEGAIVLEVWPTTADGIAVRRLRSGADTAAARSARSGPRAKDLHARSVAIVSVGALGSFIADLLVRSGIGRLTLVDGDVVMPGNLVRHLVGPEAIGLQKATAVKNHLLKVHGLNPSQINAIDDDITAGDAAIELLQEHDLVINATADFAITALFRLSAEALGTNFLSVALQNAGSTFRIDILPPLAEAAPLPASNMPNVQPTASFFEAGCGSPISPTPPYAVVEAAAAAVRHSIGLLLGAPLQPSGEVRHLNPALETSDEST